MKAYKWMFFLLVMSTLVLTPSSNALSGKSLSGKGIFFLVDHESMYVQGNVELWEYDPDTQNVNRVAQRILPDTETVENSVPSTELDLMVKAGFVESANLDTLKLRHPGYFIDKIALSPDRSQLLVSERIGVCFQHGFSCYGNIRLWLDNMDETLFPQKVLLEIPIHSPSWSPCIKEKNTEVQLHTMKWSPSQDYVLIGIVCGTAQTEYYHVVRISDSKHFPIGDYYYADWASATNNFLLANESKCPEFEEATIYGECSFDLEIRNANAPSKTVKTIELEHFWWYGEFLEWSGTETILNFIGGNADNHANELRKYDYVTGSSETILLMGHTVSADTSETGWIANLQQDNSGLKVMVFNHTNLLASVVVDNPLRLLQWGTSSNELWGYERNTSKLLHFDISNQRVEYINLSEMVKEKSGAPYVEIIGLAP